MKKRIGVLLSIAIALVFNACAQEHQKKEAWLESANEIKQQLVVLHNSQQQVPVVNLKDQKFASINLGFRHFRMFDSLLNKYSRVKPYDFQNYRAENALSVLKDDLKFNHTIIIALTDSLAAVPQISQFIDELQQQKKIILVLFGPQQSLSCLDNYEQALIWCPQKTEVAAEIAAQVIFGGESASATLPETVSPKYTKGAGAVTSIIRLGYSVPEAVGINSNSLSAIDGIAGEAIAAAATPGCAVLVAKNGKIIFNKAYGYHTYAKEQANQVTDIYDLASVTKVAATTLEVMKLYDEKKIALDAPVSDYLARTQHTDKADIPVKNILLHQAGFIPYIPFHDAIKPEDHRADSSENFPTKVADGYYLRKDYYQDVMWPQMLKAPLRTPGRYVYSDLSMYYMKEIIEHITEKPLQNLVETDFYEDLGLQSTTFLPRNKFSRESIVPTEKDTYFRDTLIWGYVHDQGAALAGGVSGHAGLFSNITDLATIFQMLLNKGSYGGKSYIRPSTVSLFTSRQSDVSRRGLGFDRWEPNVAKEYPSKYASPQTFGHTGYTGTCVWVDPSREMIYIFLSNRVFPKVTNKLITMNIRSRIQDVINKAIDNATK